jgi:cephalosporin hydroxylase
MCATDRSVVAAAIAAAVCRDALSAMEDLDGVLGVAHVDLLAGIAIRHRVVVAGQFGVVIDANASAFPLGKLVWPLGQWP